MAIISPSLLVITLKVNDLNSLIEDIEMLNEQKCMIQL